MVNFESNNGGNISLGIDSNNHLYVNKKKVVTTNIIKVNTLLNFSIIAGSLSTVGIFTIEFLKAIKIVS